VFKLIELCNYLCALCIALFVSTLAKRLDGKTTPVILFVSKGFPYKDQIEELFVVVVILHVPTHNIFNFLINFSFCNCSILFKGTM